MHGHHSCRRWDRLRLVAVLRLAMLFATAIAIGCQDSSERPGVVCSAAASLGEPIMALAARFQAECGEAVCVNVASTNHLAQQIVAGGGADVFLSANRHWADVVQQTGRVEATVDLLTNRLVLIVPQGNPADVGDVNDLLLQRVGHIAVAGERVPAGECARQALQSAGLLERLKEDGKIVTGGSVRRALAYVARREADAGIVYRSDAISCSKVESVQLIEADRHQPIVYTLVKLHSGSEGDVADRWFQFLQSPEAASVFARYGFQPLE